MAEKYPGGPPPAYQPPPYTSPPANYMYPQASGAPPPYSQYTPSTSTHTTVTVTATPSVQQPAPKKRGLLGSIMHEVDLVGKQLGREIDYCATKIGGAVDQHLTGNVVGQFGTGCIVQLVSRSSGHCLQIVVSSTGQLVVDGNGPATTTAFNTLWTVVNEGKNQIRLHSNFNYLALTNGHTQIIHAPPGTPLGIETKFQLSQTEQFVLLEGLKEPGRYVGILPDGQLKPAVATGREQHAHFGVKMIYSPYASTTTVTTTSVKTTR